MRRMAGLGLPERTGGKGIDQAIENMRMTLRRARAQAGRRGRDGRHAARQSGEDAGEPSQADKDGWELADEVLNQWCRRLGEGTFELCQSWRLEDGRWAHARGLVDLSHVDEADLDEVCRGYCDGGLAEVRQTYGAAAPQVLAECWFESTVVSEDVEVHDDGFDPRPWVEDARREAGVDLYVGAADACGREGASRSQGERGYGSSRPTRQ